MIDLVALKKEFSKYHIQAEEVVCAIDSEIKILSSLNHPHIVRMEDHFTVGNTVFICMEYVEGGDLFDFIPAKGMTEPVARRLFFQLCSAVAYCHSNNVSFLFSL